jgi:lipid-binding SYLF domain-containing protein
MRIIRQSVVVFTVLLAATTVFAQLSKSDIKDLNESSAVLWDLRNARDSAIPEAIWSKAVCVLVIPSLKKAGFLIGGEGGSGVLSCRQADRWGPPIFMEMAKGSVGLQAGVQVTELVLVLMNRSGVERLLSNKVTLGADASVAAGPVGRGASAATDAQLSAEMLSYSRTKGVFAGIDLSGGTLKPDKSANERAYGAKASIRDIALGTTQTRVAPEAKSFMDALNR